jgi:hypothetical protein
MESMAENKNKMTMDEKMTANYWQIPKEKISYAWGN